MNEIDILKDAGALGFVLGIIAILARTIYVLVKNRKNGKQLAVNTDCFTEDDRKTMYGIKNDLYKQGVDTASCMKELKTSVDRMVTATEKQTTASRENTEKTMEGIKETTGQIKTMVELMRRNDQR